MWNPLAAATGGAAELRRRPSRIPDFERENQALLRLVRAQTGTRQMLL